MEKKKQTKASSKEELKEGKAHVSNEKSAYVQIAETIQGNGNARE